MTPPTPGLLVSVRDANEADAAIQGGASLIDVKDPAFGALGRADNTTISAVVARVAGRVPVSAAMGELIDWGATDAPATLDAGLAFVKFGLAGCGHRRGWAQLLSDLRTKIETQIPARVAAVAYADWRRADAPRPQDVIAFALDAKCSAVLFDTWQKDGSTLLEWMTLSDLMATCNHFRLAGIRVALAGALGRWQIRQLLLARPDWFAVRGSACVGDGRNGTVSAERVRGLADAIVDPESISHDSRLMRRIPELPKREIPPKEIP